MNKKTLLTGLAALVLASGIATAGKTDYNYSDDYLTNKVQTESYNHSPIKDQTMIALNGYLLKDPASPTGTIEFVAGFEYGEEQIPYLNYKFPQNGSLEGAQKAIVKFNAKPGNNGPDMMLNMEYSKTGIDWTKGLIVNKQGEYSFTIPNIKGWDNVYVSFRGFNTVLEEINANIVSNDASNTKK